MSEIERYGATWQRFAGPGSSDWDVWLLMFEDQDRGNMVFGGKDYSPGEAERLAWEAWNRLSPAWNCHLFRLAELRPGRSQSERVSRLEEALKPFARLAGPINGEEGRPTYLEAISGPNGTDELKLETYVGDGTRFEIMDAEDFRRARSALNQSDGGGNG